MVNEHLDSGRPINSINLETLADSGGGSEVILCCFWFGFLCVVC